MKDLFVYLFYDNLAKTNINVFLAKNDEVMRRTISSMYSSLNDLLRIENDVQIICLGCLDNSGKFEALNQFVCNLIDLKPNLISKEMKDKIFKGGSNVSS